MFGYLNFGFWRFLHFLLKSIEKHYDIAFIKDKKHTIKASK